MNLLSYNSIIHPYFIDNKVHVCHQGKYCTYSKPSAINIENDNVFVLDEVNKFDAKRYFLNEMIHDHKMECININDCDKLLLLGGYYGDSDTDDYYYDIQSCDITQQLETKQQGWGKLDVKLPYAQDKYDYFVVVGFDTILFYFNRIKKDIFCLDLLITNKWYKS